MARLRSALTAQPSLSKTAVYEDDGNTEGLVKEGKTRRGRGRLRKAAQKGDSLVMSGALGHGETAAALEMTIATTDELAKSDASGSHTATAKTRPLGMTRKPDPKMAHSNMIEGVKKRMAGTAAREGSAVRKKGSLVARSRVTKATAHASSDTLHTNAPTVRPFTAPTAAAAEGDLSIDDSPRSPPPPGKLKRSSLAQAPSSVIRVQNTAMLQRSVLKNFKRRPRQPSMLAMVQQRTATASARPSAVNVQQDEGVSASSFDEPCRDADDGADDDEDDFAPDAEGTPLAVSKAKRKSDEANCSPCALESFTALRAKWQKSPAVETTVESDDPIAGFAQGQTRLESTSARKSSTETERQPTPPAPQHTSDVQGINSSQSTPPPAEPGSYLDLDVTKRRRSVLEEEYLVPSTEEQQDFVHPPIEDDGHDLADDPLRCAWNGTMAEPASNPHSISIAPPATQQRRAEEFAEPVTEVSPPHERAKARQSKPKPLSTSALQNLLPKRRQPLKRERRRDKSEYDFTSDSDHAHEDDAELDASHLEQDEDELGGRLRRHAKTTPAKGRKSAAPASKAKGRQSKPPTAVRKSTTPHRTPKGAAKPTRTYGRVINISSDKENEPDDGEDAGDTSDDLPRVIAKAATENSELEAVKRKFAEIDQFEMEFESLGDEEHRSSSQQWR